MTMRYIVTTMALAACSLFAEGTLQAQMGEMSKGSPALTAQSPAQALDDLLSLYEQDTMGVVNIMPADKYSFAPRAATFAPEQAAKFDGVRTFAAQVTHVAESNYYFYSSLSGLKPDVDVKSIETLTTKEDCVAILAKSFAFAHKAIATITVQNAFEQIKPVDGMKTRLAGGVWCGAWI